jgi:multiple sugar transport system substrate-binding protein
MGRGRISTIKDVAKLAGVSHGTVSNIINGKSNVKSSTVKKVLEAMTALGYQPDANARGLRTSKSQTVAFICPSIENEQYRAIYFGIRTGLDEIGMSVRLYISSDEADREKRILAEINKERLAAAILITCIPDSPQCFLPLLQQNIALIFLGRRPNDLPGSYFISPDYREIGRQAAGLSSASPTAALILERENYSCTKELLEGFSGLYPGRILSVVHLAESAESAYKTATMWIQSGELPQIVFCSNSAFAKGVEAAFHFFCSGQTPSVLFLCSQDWMRRVNSPDGSLVQVDFFALGRLCAEKAAEFSADGSGREGSIVFPGLSDENFPAVLKKAAPQNPKQPLRIMLMRGTESHAAKLLAMKYSRLTGIPVEIDTLPYESICAQQESPAEKYDIIQVNTNTLESCVDSGILACLDRPEVNSFLQRNFSNYIRSSYSLCHEKPYAFPYMFDAQILFYRRDLFEDSQLRRLFYERYHADLQVPKTFAEIDRAAAFFSRQNTPESPVPYGITAGGAPIYSVYEWIPRYFEKGGAIGREGLDAGLASSALREYIASFSGADPEARTWKFLQQTAAFSSGNAAMMILYQAHLSDHRQQYTFEPGRNIGYAPIPCPIRGGWSLGVAAESPRKDEALDFMMWLSSSQNATPYNILGGSIPCAGAFAPSDYTSSHPWLTTALKAAKKSSPMLADAPFSQWTFEKIAGPIIHRAVSGEISPESAIGELTHQLAPYYSR